jgi:hypothetical protein
MRQSANQLQEQPAACMWLISGGLKMILLPRTRAVEVDLKALSKVTSLCGKQDLNSLTVTQEIRQRLIPRLCRRLFKKHLKRQAQNRYFVQKRTQNIVLALDSASMPTSDTARIPLESKVPEPFGYKAICHA